jgi:hypothetical protein
MGTFRNKETGEIVQGSLKRYYGTGTKCYGFNGYIYLSVRHFELIWEKVDR